MAYQFKYFRSIAILFSVCVCAGAQEHAIPDDPGVFSEQCVALADMPYADAQWQLTSGGGFNVYDVARSERKKHTDEHRLTITCADGCILLNGEQTFASKLYLVPETCKASYRGKVYEGAFGVECDEADAVFFYYPTQKSSLHLESGKAESSAVKKVEPQKGAQENESSSYAVRVLLDEHTAEDGRHWLLQSSQGFLIGARQDPASLEVVSQPKLDITHKHGGIYLNGKRWQADGIFIKPVAGLISYVGNTYQGTFSVRCLQDRVLLINILDLEDYVYAVVCAESWPGWPLEFNKVLAIACRSYVIAMVMRMRTHQVPYHIKNTNVHQCYNGVQHYEVRKIAVEQTHGVFLAHGGKPIVAMFDACCGGVVPGKIHDVNKKLTPYLARDTKCPYCKDCKVYSWQYVYTNDQMVAALKKEYSRIKKIKAIQVTRTDKAGIVLEVAIKTDRGTVVLSGKKMYALFKLRSFWYTITKKDQKIIIKGRGYGHHKGLCQWGAREMVRQGYDYKSILQFYYPQTTFMRLPDR